MDKDTNQFNWDICGQENVVKFLQTAIVNDRVAHAYLFVGPSNLGKETVANRFISSLLCKEKNSAVPCSECASCQQLKDGIYPDFYKVDRQINEKTDKLRKDITISQIRDLKNKLQQATFLNDYKIALISEAQLINNSAYNALLKILEEPTPKTIIVLAVNDIKALPQTIVSRCQVLKFLPVATKKIEECLISKNVSIDNAKKFAHLSYGLPGVAFSFVSDEIMARDYGQDVNNFFKVLKSNTGQRFDLMGQLIEWEKDDLLNIKRINKLLSSWQGILRDFLLIYSDNEPLVGNINLIKIIKDNQNYFSFSKIKKILNEIDQARNYFRQNINSKLVLENLIIRI